MGTAAEQAWGGLSASALLFRKRRANHSKDFRSLQSLRPAGTNGIQAGAAREYSARAGEAFISLFQLEISFRLIQSPLTSRLTTMF